MLFLIWINRVTCFSPEEPCMWIQIYKYWCSSHVAELCYTYMQRRGKGTVFKSLFSIFLEIRVFIHISYIFPLLWLWTTWLPCHTNFRLELQAGMNYLKSVFPHKMITPPATSSLAELVNLPLLNFLSWFLKFTLLPPSTETDLTKCIIHRGKLAPIFVKILKQWSCHVPLMWLPVFLLMKCP